MKVLKRKILLALSLPVDVFEKKEGFRYKAYNFLYFLLKFRRGSIRDAIGQLVETGEVDKIIRNNTSSFRLTGTGRERLLSFFPISIGQSRVWDRKWRIIINDRRKSVHSPVRKKVKGLNVRRIRGKLKEFGFKRLSGGAYITPMPVSQQVKNYLLEKNFLGEVVFFESRKLLSSDDKNLAQKIWRLGELMGEYGHFIKDCKRLLRKVKVEKRLKKQDKNKVVDLFNAYFSLLSRDPGLPRRVLPDDWPAYSARERFLQIIEYLESEKLLDVI